MLRFASQVTVDNLPDEMTDNLWEVVMPTIPIENSYLPYNYTPIVEEISFAPKSFENEELRVNTRFYNLPKDRQGLGDCKITMFCDKGMMPVYYMKQWRSLIFNAEHQFYYMNDNGSKGTDLLSKNYLAMFKNSKQINASANWKKDINVFFYGLGSVTPIAHVTLYNCYPISQGDYELQYSMEPKRFRLTVIFKYDNLIWDDEYQNKAIVSAILSGNPVGTVFDQLFSSLSLSSSNNTELLSNKAI